MASRTVSASGFHDGPLGRMRSRAVGRPVPGVSEVLVVQGMGVADYLLPAVAELGRWTRARLLDLPGLSGSGEPPYPLGLSDYGRAVADWLDAHRPDQPVVLVGHSSGTQVAARAAAGRTDVQALVLAAPTVDPVARSWPRLCLRFLVNGRREDPGLTRVHRPEWRRAGPRRLYRLAADCLADRLEESVQRVSAPVAVIRGDRDALSTATWARSLASDRGRYLEVDGAHSFVWSEPSAWSASIRDLAA